MLKNKYEIITDSGNIDSLWKLCRDVESWDKWDFNIIDVRKINDSDFSIKHRKFLRCKAKIVKSEYQSHFEIQISLPLAVFSRSFFFEQKENKLKINLIHTFSGFLFLFWWWIVGLKLNSYANEDLSIMVTEINRQ